MEYGMESGGLMAFIALCEQGCYPTFECRFVRILGFDCGLNRGLWLVG